MTRQTRPQWLAPLVLTCAGCTGILSSSGEMEGGTDVGEFEAPDDTNPDDTNVVPTTEFEAPGGTNVVPTTELDSGRVVLRRLNRTEYDNTMRDLLGSTSNLAKTTPFAADDVADHFDTIGQNLVMSLLLTEQMDQAASTLVAELLARPAGDQRREDIVTCEPDAQNFDSCISEILTPFMKKAYRRPVTTDEVQERLALANTVFESSGSPQTGLSAALKSVLLSPHFIYRVELGAPDSPDATPLSGYELATRLSYFLWASMPDQALFDAAEAGELSPAGPELREQVTRMLADPKAEGFIESFAGQWLSARDAKSFVAEDSIFPNYDDALRESMPRETNLFFEALISEEQPLTALMLGDFTFVNDRLAEHYGLPWPPPGNDAGATYSDDPAEVPSSGGDDFTRTNLSGTERMGILGHASVLAVTSHPNRTSPVKRADWVLDRLLCDPPPAAPAMIPAIREELPEGLSFREELEAHRAEPSCASCHNIMDPIGFALEHFDATGAYRTMDNGSQVDSSGQMADGTYLEGHKDLARAVADDPDFAICVAKQMLTFAVGRSFSNREAKAYAAGIGLSHRDATWPEFIEAVVMSEAFRTRRGEAP